MDSKTLLLEDKTTEDNDTSVTAGDLVVSPRWERPAVYLGAGSGDDVLTAAVVLMGTEFVIEKPTSAFIIIFPELAAAVPLDTSVEIDVRFPPKRTRPLTGKLIRRGRAEFRTAFADELVKIQEPGTG